MKLVPFKKKSGRNGGLLRGGDGASALSRFRAEMDRLFERFFRDPWSVFDETSWASSWGWNPALDVIDGEKEVTVRAEIPGVDPKDVEVTVSGNLLTIAGEKKDVSEEKGKNFYRSECSYGSFRRSVALPEGVDADKVQAEYSNGVLTVRVAKSKTAAPRKIAITAK
ncbi:MAG TPA: Hsp20/alpha crystallin family protein [Planctomycetota bacterium]|nr:Hsp20/alpha crystallin family protein [Planctomycetota bacterium]